MYLIKHLSISSVLSTSYMSTLSYTCMSTLQYVYNRNEGNNFNKKIIIKVLSQIIKNLKIKPNYKTISTSRFSNF